MEPENVLKGKIARSLVSELLKKSGNKVFMLSSDSLLENLDQSEKSFSRDSQAGKKISSIPDFFIINFQKKPFFVEVKFRKEPEALEEELLLEKEYLERFWEAKIILVTVDKPYFRISTPPYFKKEKKEGWPIPVFDWQPLEADLDFSITSPALKKFEKLVEKYYSSKKSATD